MQICENGDGIRMGIQSKKWCGYDYLIHRSFDIFLWNLVL